MPLLLASSWADCKCLACPALPDTVDHQALPRVYFGDANVESLWTMVCALHDKRAACRVIADHRSVKRKALEHKERADKAEKEIRRQNLQIGKLEAKLQGSRANVIPLGPNNGKAAPGDEGRAFAAQHTALVQELESLKEENRELKQKHGDSDLYDKQVLVAQPSSWVFGNFRLWIPVFQARIFDCLTSFS